MEKREDVAISLLESQMYEEALEIYASLNEEGYDTFSYEIGGIHFLKPSLCWAFLCLLIRVSNSHG